MEIFRKDCSILSVLLWVSVVLACHTSVIDIEEKIRKKIKIYRIIIIDVKE